MEPLSRRRFLRVSAATVAAGALPGCAVPFAGGAPDRSNRVRVVGLVVPEASPPAIGVASGVRRGLEGSGYALRAITSGSSAARALADVQARLLPARVSGIVMLPVTVESAARAAAAASAVGTPVVDALSPGPGAGDQLFAGQVDTGIEEGGRMLAREVLRRRPDGGEIVVVQGVLGRGVSELLDRGFGQVIASSRGHRIVLRGPAGDDREQAAALVRTALAAHPRARIVVSHSAAMANGIARALREDGRDDVLHLANGADPETLLLVGSPQLAAARYWSPARAGLEAARLVLDALESGAAQAEPYRRGVPTGILDRPGPPPGDPPVYVVQARGLRFEPAAPPVAEAPGQVAPSGNDNPDEFDNDNSP